MGEPLSSILAISALAYVDPLNRISEEKIQMVASKLESAISKIPGNKFNKT
jgi:hypothetical protein